MEICGHIGGDASGAVATVCQLRNGHSGKHGGMGCWWDDSATPGRISGDKGERFEVHAVVSLSEQVVGWHNSLEGASSVADSFFMKSEVLESWVVDRANQFARVYGARKAT